MPIFQNPIRFQNKSSFLLNSRFVYFAGESGDRNSGGAPESERQKKSILSYNFGNTINELRAQLADEQDKKKKKGIEAQIAGCEKVMKDLEKPVENQSDVDEAIEQIKNLENNLGILDKDAVSYIDLISSSQLAPFFGKDTIAGLETATPQIEATLSVKEIMGDNTAELDDSLIKSQAEEGWKKREKELKTMRLREADFKKEFEAFQEKMSALGEELESGKISDKEYRNRRAELIREWESYLKELSASSDESLYSQLDKAKSPSDEDRELWIEQEVDRLRIEKQRKFKLTHAKDKIPYDSIEKVKLVLAEARAYRKAAIEEFIHGRIRLVKTEYKSRGWPSEDLDLLKNGLREKSGDMDTVNLIAAVEAVNMLEKRTSALSKREDDLETKKVSPEIKGKIEYIRRTLGAIGQSKEGLSEISAMLKDPMKEHEPERFQAPDKPKVVSADQEGMSKLSDPSIILKDLEDDLNSPNLDVSSAALIAIDGLYKSTRRIEANKARSIITRLKYVSTLDEMLQIVKEDAGSEHIEFVRGGEFESKYRKYTAKGNMVFYQKGDVWKIIINQDVARGDKIADEFRNQISHELRHLEFDYDEDIQRKELDRFTANPHNWQKIKKAFVNKVNPKTPPNYKGKKKYFKAEDWEDEDVINELYAMQNDIAKHVINDSHSKFNKLVKEIANAGLLPVAALTAAETIKGFEGEDEKEIIRGAELSEDAAVETSSYSSFMPPQEVDLQENKFKIDTVKSRINAIRKSGYMSDIPNASSILSNIENALNNQPWNAGLIDDAANDVEYIEKQIKDLSQSVKKGGVNPLRSFWNNTKFISIGDIVQLSKDVYEFYSRRHKRREQDHAARLGEALFSRIPLLKELGMDASANKEKAESEYVNEWKSRLENKDAWVLKGMIDEMANQIDPNKDQLKAIMRILSEKGRIDWQQQGLWKVLNKLQNDVQFQENDEFLMQNPAALNQKMMAAMGSMWDYDEFLSLQSKNESSYESKKNEHMNTYDKLQGELDNRMGQLLALHRQGKEADPMEFEAIIEYSIKKGQSHQESVFFHLMTGMAIGLLSPDRGIHLNKDPNIYPQIEFFKSIDPPPTAKYFENMCMTYFGDDFQRGKKGAEFQTFYWTVVQNNETVKQRIQKSAAPDAWDHDWSRGIAVMGGADTCERFLNGRSGQKATRPTAVANAMGGALQWLDENAKRPGKNWDDNIADQIGWIAMANGIMEGVAYKDSVVYTRKEAVQGKKVREGSVTHHKGKNAEQHYRKLQRILDAVDPVFFGMIRNKAVRDRDKEGTELAEGIKNYLLSTYGDSSEIQEIVPSLNSVNDVFKNLQPIVNVVVSKNMNRMNYVRSMLVNENGEVIDDL